ncbi:TadE/TadG family type IV pilus assembly protein [Cellulomonas sp. NTE-D12]|uniref:TadE/TadG family type IV pilus assembly protein n=1 Tax=Cellulomonas sp. NTE-D12 TaxID=2962632 RepID=UPI00308182E1|nr:membrane protein [Cellulomonas sp. NTE-D12]
MRHAAIGGERGAVSLELAILVPALLLLLGALVLVGRVETSSSAVEQAARAAARDASIARTPDAARATAMQAAQRELAGSGCASSNVTVDTAGFTAPVGTDAAIHVQVTCTVSVADLAIPGLPGTRTLTGAATSPLDRYRSR